MLQNIYTSKVIKRVSKYEERLTRKISPNVCRNPRDEVWEEVPGDLSRSTNVGATPNSPSFRMPAKLSIQKLDNKEED